MRARIYTPPTSVPIVGIDDWAWKKGMTYGTILVDLQNRRPIEILPDRSAETAEAWLRTHPEITLVSRDRGGDYAAAAKRGAPQAEQVADKFHLLKNLRERIKCRLPKNLAVSNRKVGHKYQAKQEASSSTGKCVKLQKIR
jgi:transposase